MEIARSLHSFALPLMLFLRISLHISGKLRMRQPCDQYTNRQHTMIGEVIKPQSDKLGSRRTLSRRVRIRQLRKVRVRRMPEVHLMGRYLSLFGTDVDRNEPVQKDGHGAFRSAKRLVAFCHFPALSDLVEVVVSRGRESSLSTTVTFLERYATVLQHQIAVTSLIPFMQDLRHCQLSTVIR
jgi:hypothetical protein